MAPEISVAVGLSEFTGGSYKIGDLESYSDGVTGLEKKKKSRAGRELNLAMSPPCSLSNF